MTTIGELDLRQPTDIPVDGGGLSAHDGQIALATPSGESIRAELVGLRRSDYAVYWTDGQRLVLVGLRARDVVLADPRAELLAVVGELDRLDLSDTYDPGGLESIRIVDVTPTRLAIIYEVGLALLDLDSRSLVWQRTHDDVQASFQAIRDGVLWFEAEHGTFGFRAEDGVFQVE